MTTLLITEPAQLQEHCARWALQPWLAIDTEFVRVDTYHARPCLVQVGDGSTSACIDLIALGDLSPLMNLLHLPGVIKVLHSAGQDYEIFVQVSGDGPRPLFDTQIAATLLGFGDQIGYAGLIESLLGIAVDKSLSRTDWTRRPLREVELAYAAADVQHLAAVYPGLRQRLVDAGRLAWLEEDCARMAHPQQYRSNPAQAWQRLKGIARLPAGEQVVAAALAHWREEEAIARNRPRKWIIEDDAIYRIAQRRPQNLAQMEALKVLPPKTLDRHGAALLQVVARAVAEPVLALAVDEALDAAQKQTLQALQDELRRIAGELKLPPSFVAPRAALLALTLRRTTPEMPLMQGWRWAVAGERLRAMVG